MDNLSPLKDTSSKAFDDLFSRFNYLEAKKVLIYAIDNVEASALPHLAEQFHITGNEGWLHCKNEKEKRELIKNAIEIHRYKGTKFALKKVLEILNLNGKITEWFEYSGNPYHFQVSLDLKDQSYDNITEKQLIDLIEENKNVRSVMEKLQINLTTTAKQSIRTAFITSEEITL